MNIKEISHVVEYLPHSCIFNSSTMQLSPLDSSTLSLVHILASWKKPGSLLKCAELGQETSHVICGVRGQVYREDYGSSFTYHGKLG